MSRPGPETRDPSARLGVALALLAAVVLAPTPARAGCAHDRAGGAQAPEQFGMLRACGAIETEADVRPGDRIPAHPANRPVCSGPSCSGRSGLPMAPSSFDPPRISQWAMVEVPVPGNAPRISRRHRDGRHPRAILVAEAVFHPPRTAALAG